MKKDIRYWLACALIMLACNTIAKAQGNQPGIFDEQADIGPVKHPGSASYDPTQQRYTISGSGTNVWTSHDEFHFVWKKMKGDFILRTNAAFIGKGVEAHRKIGWMIRTSLDTNSKHVSAVVHGDGLTSLQYRRAASGATEEMRSTITHADVIQLERRGGVYTMSVAHKGETFVTEKISDVDLGDDVYVGLFVCAHNPDVTEKATFNNVRIIIPAWPTLVPYHDYLGSAIEVLDVATQNSTIIYQSPASIQAPNWKLDGKTLLYNKEGLLYNFNMANHISTVINTGVAIHNNNDHVMSFDGKWLAVSSGNGDHGASIGFVVALTSSKKGILEM